MSKTRWVLLHVFWNPQTFEATYTTDDVVAEAESGVHSYKKNPDVAAIAYSSALCTKILWCTKCRINPSWRDYSHEACYRRSIRLSARSRTGKRTLNGRASAACQLAPSSSRREDAYGRRCRPVQTNTRENWERFLRAAPVNFVKTLFGSQATKSNQSVGIGHVLAIAGSKTSSPSECTKKSSTIQERDYEWLCLECFAQENRLQGSVSSKMHIMSGLPGIGTVPAFEIEKMPDERPSLLPPVRLLRFPRW